MIFLDLFWTFFKIGLFTFGGGYAMLPLIQSAVLEHGWMESEMLVNFVAVSESTPGPFAINMATFVGSTMGGVFGAFCATLGVVLPSFVIILLVARCFSKFRSSKPMRGIMYGLKPAVVGMIASALLSVAGTVFFPAGVSAAVFTTPLFYVSLAITALMIVLSVRKVHPILIIALSALLGIVAGYALHLPI